MFKSITIDTLKRHVTLKGSPQIRHWLNLHTYVALLIIMSSTASKWLVLPLRREGRDARIYQRHRRNMHRIKQSTLLKVVHAIANYTA